MFSRYIPQDPISRQAERNARNAAVAEEVRRAKKPSITMGGCTSGVPIEKEDASQSGAYMTAAKALGYCMRCGIQVPPLTGLLDFAHADFGKGQGIKTDVRLGFPSCRRCHNIVGREMPRAVRRAVEWLLGVMTRAAVMEAGTWPKRLAKLNEKDQRA